MDLGGFPETTPETLTFPTQRFRRLQISVLISLSLSSLLFQVSDPSRNLYSWRLSSHCGLRVLHVSEVDFRTAPDLAALERVLAS